MYILLNHGDFIDGSTPNMANPYIQFISTTDPATALAEFVVARLGGKDTTGSRHISGPNSGSGSILPEVQDPRHRRHIGGYSVVLARPVAHDQTSEAHVPLHL
jgi:hypothetical protein